MDEFEERMKGDDIIFHYTKLSTALEHILSHKQLQFSSLSKMNDPRERNYWTFGHPRLMDDNTFNTISSLQMILNKIRTSEYKIACLCLNKVPEEKSETFSVEKDWYGWNRLRMWAQYADNFRGVCIAFSASAIMKKLDEQLGDEILKKGDAVKYLPNYYQHDLELREIDPYMVGDEPLEKYAASYIKENLSSFFLAKPIDYRDEVEYRIIVHDPADKFKHLDISDCIRGVILGEKCHNVYHDSVRNLCDRLRVQYRQHRWVAGRMTLSKLWYGVG